MSSEIMQETTPLVECSAFHLGMSVLEASLRNTEDSDAIISGLLKGAAEFYGASRASVVEADWDLGIGVITYEWCKDGVSAQRDMLQCLPMEKFPRWRKALRANKPVVISDLQRLEKVYPDEAAFFREYGVATLLASQSSSRRKTSILWRRTVSCESPSPVPSPSLKVNLSPRMSHGGNAVPWKPERSASNIKSCTATAKVRMVSRRSFRNRPKSSDGSMSAISPEPACG